MKPWIEKAIQSWHRWVTDHSHSRAALEIPPHAQIGKILEAHGGNVQAARLFVAEQVIQDSVLSSFDNYWTRVDRQLEELIVNDIILE